MSNINKDILKKASQNVIGKFKIPIRNLTLRLIRDNKEINLVNTRSVFYDFLNNRFEDPNSQGAQEFIETINGIFNSIFGQTVLSLETFNEYKKQINRNFYSDFSPANQGDSKEEIDPDMLELLQEYRESIRKEKEKAKAPKLLRSLTNDDDAELFTAILPDEDGNSPIHSDEISNILDTEGFDAAVKKARKIRKSKKGGKRRKKRKTKRKKRKKKRKTRRKQKGGMTTKHKLQQCKSRERFHIQRIQQLRTRIAELINNPESHEGGKRKKRRKRKTRKKTRRKIN